MLTAVDDQRTAALGDEEHVVVVGDAALGRAPGAEADHALLEQLAALGRADRPFHEGRVAVGTHALDVVLGDHVGVAHRPISPKAP